MKYRCQSCGKGGAIDNKIETIQGGKHYVSFDPFHIFLCPSCSDRMTGKPALKLTWHTPEDGHQKAFLFHNKPK